MNQTAGENISEISTRLQRGFRAMVLSHNSALSTAFANDVDPTLCYAQQLYVMAKPGDAVIGITTSGNAKNVLAVFRVARGIGVKTILLTGNRHGVCEKYADSVIAAPSSETYRVQEYHLPIYHCICMMLENEFYGK